MRKINWGVLGTADIARGQTIPGMAQAENCRLYAIAGRSMEKAKAYQAEFGFEVACDSYDQLLSDPKVEAVYIPLPNHIHKEWVIRALNAKKHVLCEKPLGLNAGEVSEMIACAEDNGVYLMEAFAYLHSPLTAAVRAELPRLGKILYMDSCFVTSVPNAANIRMHRETGGGSVYDLGCYSLSQMQWMLGEPETVRAVAEFTDCHIDTCASGVLTFPGGVQATFVCGMTLREKTGGRIDRCLIHGERGYIVNNCEFNQCGEIPYTVVRDGVSVSKTVTIPNNYMLEVEQLSRCILTGEKPLVSKEFSLRAARVTDRILDAIGY